MRAGTVAMPIADPVPRDEAPDLLERGDAGGRQAAQVVAPMVEVRLEVARPSPEPGGDLGQDAPGKMLEGLAPGVPGREDGRPEELGMAVLVAMEWPDVVGGDDADGPRGRHRWRRA